MKLTNGKILGTLNSIYQSGIAGKKLPVKLSYALSKNLNKLNLELEPYNKERDKVVIGCVKMGENGEPQTTEDGKNYVFDSKTKEKEYLDKMNELLNIECEIEFHQVSLDDLEKCDLPEYDSLTVSEISLLDFMITD